MCSILKSEGGGSTGGGWGLRDDWRAPVCAWLAVRKSPLALRSIRRSDRWECALCTLLMLPILLGLRIGTPLSGV